MYGTTSPARAPSAHAPPPTVAPVAQRGSGANSALAGKSDGGAPGSPEAGTATSSPTNLGAASALLRPDDAAARIRRHPHSEHPPRAENEDHIGMPHLTTTGRDTEHAVVLTERVENPPVIPGGQHVAQLRLAGQGVGLGDGGVRHPIGSQLGVSGWASSAERDRRHDPGQWSGSGPPGTTAPLAAEVGDPARDRPPRAGELADGRHRARAVEHPRHGQSHGQQRHDARPSEPGTRLLRVDNHYR
ncbi:hypothetical protein SAMN05216174_11014 [Actinokineospora iranica]|uniref:Uncharacterized protein n=1 Tax=Actinokineospora iranica TaxID=1271860 RepID=A0A1G6U0U6_9PSEU|nr:hypothetical protein SAMN05216174_11014 [Actinokineospora iranica]